MIPRTFRNLDKRILLGRRTWIAIYTQHSSQNVVDFVIFSDSRVEIKLSSDGMSTGEHNILPNRSRLQTDCDIARITNDREANTSFHPDAGRRMNHRVNRSNAPFECFICVIARPSVAIRGTTIRTSRINMYVSIIIRGDLGEIRESIDMTKWHVHLFTAYADDFSRFSSVSWLDLISIKFHVWLTLEMVEITDF